MAVARDERAAMPLDVCERAEVGLKDEVRMIEWFG
jgi:hypothetical protein